MWIRLTSCALILVLCAVTGCRSGARQGGASTPGDNSPVVVEINGTPEHLAAFERFMKARLSDFYSQIHQNQPESDDLRSRLFDEFVQRQMIVLEARKRGLAATEEEIGRALEDQHQQTSVEGVDPNQTTLVGSERRLEIANDLLTMKYYQAEVLKNVSIAAEEVEKYYRENAARYQQQNGFYVREIRVPTAEEAEPLHVQALRKPSDFATLARQHSRAPHAKDGGLIYYETQQMPPVLEEAISPLKVGSISKVVHSNYGYHIFKLEARAEPLSLEKVRGQIEEDLLSRKNQALIDAYNERTLAATRIRVYRERLGFNYTGQLSAMAKAS
jgi:parvulin-like peptidyl-prolyl isomerase